MAYKWKQVKGFKTSIILERIRPVGRSVSAEKGKNMCSFYSLCILTK